MLVRPIGTRYRPDFIVSAGRFERHFVIFTAYLDESNTGSKEPDITVAGYLGSARQWRLVERRLRDLKRKEGFMTFHATRFKARQDDFHGWSDIRCSNLVNALAILVRDELTEAVTTCLPFKRFVSEYRDTPFSKGVPRFSQYGLCIYLLLNRLVQIVREKPGNNRLHLVVEDGHRKAGTANTVFAALKEQLGAEGTSLLGTVTIAKKDECELLMMADFQAHASRVSDSWERAGRPGYLKMAGIRQPGKGEAAITFASFPPGGLQRVKDGFVRLQEAKKEGIPQAEGRLARFKGDEVIARGAR
jgi:hypothetical protein